MENNRDKLVVILAGYTGEMDEFLSSNSGFRSRISKTIEFDDYTLEELELILKRCFDKEGYNYTDVENKLKNILSKRYKSPDFGNARGVRNIYECINRRHKDRINRSAKTIELTNEDMLTITAEDIDI